MSDSTRRVLLCWLFMLSGACGLIYEAIWPHYLKLFLGHAAYSQTLVLVVFIGGMALGAAICGRFAARIRRPLLAYAGVELLIGLMALVFHTVYVGATNWAYDVLLPATCGESTVCLPQWGLSALLILPQSILLGMTFPLMAAGVLRVSQDGTGRALGFLYAQNTLGGVAGVLLSTFVLIPMSGLPGTLMTAGFGNIFLAIFVYGLSREETREPCPSGAVAVNPSWRVSPRLMLAIAGLTGLSSFFYEVLWIRMLNLVLGTSTHAFELMLASFLLGLAIGGYWIRRRIDVLTRPLVTLARIQIAMGVLAVLTLPVYDQLFDLMANLMAALSRTDGGYVLFNAGSAVLALVVMLPATIAAGMTLPLITQLLMRSGHGEAVLGRVYATNTLGGILGVILVVQLFMPLIGIKYSLILAGAIDVALGIGLLVAYRNKAPNESESIPWAGFAAIFMLVAPFVFSMDNYKTAAGVFRHGRVSMPSSARILFHKDGKTATVDVTVNGGQASIHTNGKPDAAIRVDTTESKELTADTSTMVMTGLVGPLHHPNARTAAVIGFGSGMSTASMLAVPTLTRVDTIEIEAAMVDGARAFRPLNERAYTDPRSHIVIDDAKAYFSRGQRKYDIIVSEPSNPWVSA